MKYSLRKLTLRVIIICSSCLATHAQVGINTSDPRATLDIRKSPGVWTNKSSAIGIMIPRMTLDSINTAVKLGMYTNLRSGLLVYIYDTSPIVTDLPAAPDVAEIGSTGFFFLRRDGIWRKIASTAEGWGLGGNTATNPPTDFLGTTDANALVFKTNGQETMRLVPQGANPGYVGVNSTNPQAILDVASTNSGVLFPRIASAASITTPTNSMLYWNTTNGEYQFYKNGTWYTFGSLQSLSLNTSNYQLAISGGNNADFTPIIPKSMTLTSSTLNLNDRLGNTISSVDLSSLNTDAQTLSLNTATKALSISGGNNVDFTPIVAGSLPLTASSTVASLTLKSASGTTIGTTDMNPMRYLKLTGNTLAYDPTNTTGLSVNLSSLNSATPTISYNTSSHVMSVSNGTTTNSTSDLTSLLRQNVTYTPTVKDINGTITTRGSINLSGDGTATGGGQVYMDAIAGDIVTTPTAVNRSFYNFSTGATYTVQPNDYTVWSTNTTTTNPIVYLPDPSQSYGRVIVVVNQNASKLTMTTLSGNALLIESNKSPGTATAKSIDIVGAKTFMMQAAPLRTDITSTNGKGSWVILLEY